MIGCRFFDHEMKERIDGYFHGRHTRRFDETKSAAWKEGWNAAFYELLDEIITAGEQF